MAHETHVVIEDDDGQRLDRIVKRLRPTWPHVLVQKLLRKGAIKVDGRRVAMDARVTVGQVITMPLADQEQAAPKTPVRPRDQGALDILYEDHEILVINKPAGLAVQGGSGLTMHLEMILAAHARAGIAPRLVHRLDRETAGVMVVARTARAARRLTEAFTDRRIDKEYWALVSPPPKTTKGTITRRLLKVSKGKNIETMMVDDAGDDAMTDYQVMAIKDSIALVAFRPQTGRTHQIRVHAAHIGAPLLGDGKYGGDETWLKAHGIKPRVMLQARVLGFDHPRSGERMNFTAPLAEDFARALEILGLDKE
jgi:23S rRNA pseudouridine955/2504/2580 synthase